MQVEITFAVTPDCLFLVNPDGTKVPVEPIARLDQIERRNQQPDERMAGLGCVSLERIERHCQASLRDASSLKRRLDNMPGLLPLNAESARIEQARQLFDGPARNRSPYAHDLDYARSFFIQQQQHGHPCCPCACHLHNQPLQS